MCKRYRVREYDPPGGGTLAFQRGVFAARTLATWALEGTARSAPELAVGLTHPRRFRLPELSCQLRRELFADVLAGVLPGPLVRVIQVPVRAVPHAVPIFRAVGLAALDHLPLEPASTPTLAVLYNLAGRVVFGLPLSDGDDLLGRSNDPL